MEVLLLPCVSFGIASLSVQKKMVSCSVVVMRTETLKYHCYRVPTVLLVRYCIYGRVRGQKHARRSNSCIEGLNSNSLRLYLST